jgi:hypothetical protein
MAVEEAGSTWKTVAKLVLIVLLSAHVHTMLRRPHYINVDGKLTVRLLGAGLLLWGLYYTASDRLTSRYEGLQRKAMGHRFVIGAWPTEHARTYLQGDNRPSFTEMVDDHPDAVDSLWTPSSVSVSYAILGILYVGAVSLLGLSLVAAAECASEVARRILDGKHDAPSHEMAQAMPSSSAQQPS